MTVKPSRVSTLGTTLGTAFGATVCAKIYSECVKSPVSQWALRSLDRASAHRDESMKRLKGALAWRGRPRVWMHGASVGELASLWPVVRALAPHADCVVTAFSDSALGTLRTHQHDEGIAFAGLSPMEGQWDRALEWIRPEVFVSVRYEAWPELWQSLARRRIPLLQLQAQDRPSLKLAQTFASSDAKKSGWEPYLDTDDLGDPRWDEIAWQASHPSDAFQKWLSEVQAHPAQYPRPWGVLGSAWANEWAAWMPQVSHVLKGTLFCFPHDLTTAQDPRWAPAHLATMAPSAARIEMLWVHGWLTAFYQHADWAWVGGGHLNKSVHSILEPAAAGIPVVCGPRGLKRFRDYGPFLENGQVVVADRPDRWTAWFSEFMRKFDDKRATSRFDHSRLRGAGARVADWIRSRLAGGQA